ncbi:MAG: C10 family peptidase [Muribaculaceae bacterium]
MKNFRLKIAIMSLVTAAISLVSCESDVSVSSPETVFEATAIRAVPTAAGSKLNPSVVELDAADAATVASIYINSNESSRSGAVKSVSRSGNAQTVKNIVAINDAAGNPAIYAVNYEDGYIMVSATQKYFPVLAEVEHGTFTLDVLKETGMEVVVDEMLADITLAKSGKYDFKTSKYWRDYVDNDTSQMRRSISEASDDYWEEYERWWFSDGVYGNNVYYLHDCFEKEILSEDVYNSYVRAAQDEDLWEGTDYSWWWTAYVVEQKTSTSKFYGPFLTTKWHQKEPYNTTGKGALGCVTIATGQLMKYYRHPSIFNWNNMPDVMNENTVAPELTSFLARLRTELNVTDDGAATILDAQRVLQSYGYNVTLINHDLSKVVSSLEKNRPVYARGIKSGESVGHAWVIDGLEDIVNRTEYVLYRLADNYYPKFRYMEAQSYDKREEYSTITKLHYNWGWGGYQDGWFMYYGTYLIESDQNPYTSDRMDLIINSYK